MNKRIEAKLTHIGEISVKIQMHKNDLGDTESSLEDNSKFYGDLKRDCSKKTAEYEERCKMRAMELAALADTIKVLNVANGHSLTSSHWRSAVRRWASGKSSR